MHFEKGSYFAARNQHLPPYDTGQTLSVLERTIARYQPAQIIALGDSFHDMDGAQRLSVNDRGRIIALTRSYQWIWIAGNHDPAPAPDLGGEAMEELIIDGITLRHEPCEQLTGIEIAGHLHPVATIITKARKLRRRVFVANDQRLIMPAFGAYTGGLNVCSEAFSPLLKSRPFHAWALGENQVFPISSTRLRR
jgi:DNA ligase-associated metallophosphoesterase